MNKGQGLAISGLLAAALLLRQTGSDAPQLAAAAENGKGTARARRLRKSRYLRARVHGLRRAIIGRRRGKPNKSRSGRHLKLPRLK